jgi:hypothetical protein
MDNGNIGVLSISAALAFRTTIGRKTNSWVSDQDIAKVSICAFFLFWQCALLWATYLFITYSNYPTWRSEISDCVLSPQAYLH